jgi:U3 small nucleolar RNA-associated protein 25
MESKYLSSLSMDCNNNYFNRAKYLRQTLVFADFLTPEFNALFNKHMKNISGKLKIKHAYEEGSIMDVIPQVQQVIIYMFNLHYVTNSFFLNFNPPILKVYLKYTLVF